MQRNSAFSKGKCCNTFTYYEIAVWYIQYTHTFTVCTQWDTHTQTMSFTHTMTDFSPVILLLTYTVSLHTDIKRKALFVICITFICVLHKFVLLVPQKLWSFSVFAPSRVLFDCVSVCMYLFYMTFLLLKNCKCKYEIFYSKY